MEYTQLLLRTIESSLDKIEMLLAFITFLLLIIVFRKK